MAALAVVLTAVGPCLCLPEGHACHQSAKAEASSSHGCCSGQQPAVQAEPDECCDADLDLVAAATDVPKVAPPALHVGLFAPQPVAVEGASAGYAAPTPSPPALDRSPVLLI